MSSSITPHPPFVFWSIHLHPKGLKISMIRNNANPVIASYIVCFRYFKNEYLILLTSFVTTSLTGDQYLPFYGTNYFALSRCQE